MTRAIEVWDKLAGHVMYEWRVIEAESVEVARPVYPTARYVGGVLEWCDALHCRWFTSYSQHWTLEEASQNARDDVRDGAAYVRQYRLVPYPDTTYAESPDVRDATFLYTKGDETRPDSVTYPREERHELVLHSGPREPISIPMLPEITKWLTEQYATNHALSRGSDHNDYNILVDAMALFAATRHDLIEQRREGRADWSSTIEAAWRVELSDQQREQFSEQVRMFRTMLTHLVQRT